MGKGSFLNGVDGDQSSKRVFTLILMILWIIYFFANLFWGKVLKQSFEENLFYLIVFFYAGITIEKAMNWFGKKSDTSKTTETTTTEIKKEETKP